MLLRLVPIACALAVACTSAPAAPAGPTAAAPAAPGRTPRIGSFDRPVVMAFLPSGDVARVTAGAKGVTAALEKATALKWDARVPSSHAAVIDDLCAGQVDIAWLAPLAFVAADQRNCADLLLAVLRPDETGKPSPTYSTQIITRSDAGVTTLRDLKGKRFAFMDPLPSPATLYSIYAIKKETGEDVSAFFSQVLYTGNAIAAVYLGQVDAAASSIDARDGQQAIYPDIKDKTKRLFTAGPVPNEAIAVRKSFPSALREQIARALTEYARTNDGKKALRGLYGIDGLTPLDARAYDGLLDGARIAGIDLAREAAMTPTPAPRP